MLNAPNLSTNGNYNKSALDPTEMELIKIEEE